MPQTRDMQPLPQVQAGPQHPPTRTVPATPNPSAAVANGWVQLIKAEGSNVPQVLNVPGVPPNSVSNQRNLAHASPAATDIHKPAEAASVAGPNQTSTALAPSDTPPLDSSSTAEHNPPVGFFTARAAESLQKGAAPPSNVPIFNLHLESPSIRKTAGIDHTKSKPVLTESIRASPAAATVPPRANFVNLQADRTRKVGMPMGAGSPLQNRGSYKPPQMKRTGDGLGTS